MRVVVCDEDAFLREMVEAVVTGAGHEVAGIADTSAVAVGLIEAARPDAAIIDVSLGFNTDFDMVAAALDVGALPIVFAQQVDADALARYDPRPEFVPKPDLTALEQVLARLERTARGVGEHDRRQRPARAAAGPPPTGVTDAQAFFEAINEAQPGDAMASVELASGATAVAEAVAPLLRATDRLLAFPTAVRVFLPGGGEEAVRSLRERVAAADVLAGGGSWTSVVVADGELGADAFGRLKQQPVG